MSNLMSAYNTPKGWIAADADKIVFKKARLIDPSIKLDEVTDLVVENGKIAKIGSIEKGWKGKIIDAEGWIICPGFFDMHVHLREPGFEYKETVESGCQAAIAGGFTGIACMPNTNPPIDNPGLVRFIREKANGYPVEVHPVAAITVGRKGEVLTELAELYETGVRGFSDDGSPVDSAELMRRVLEYTRMFDAVIIEHCEDSSLSDGGVMHEGAVSTELGLPGWPSIAEDIAVARNICLAEYTGGRLHIAHISTAGSVELLRQAKAKGVNVTTEVTPHHLTLECGQLENYNTNFKVNPPLRTQADVDALVKGLADGTIDVVATDHAPHSTDEKEVEFLFAPFGMIGLETAFGVLNTKLVIEEKVDLNRLITALTRAPREILRLDIPKIENGSSANLTFFDPQEEWVVDRENMLSKSTNTPFHGWRLTGKVCGVINESMLWMREEKYA